MAPAQLPAAVPPAAFRPAAVPPAATQRTGVRSLLRSARGGSGERGAGSLEYVGLAVVVSVIIAGLVAVPWMPRVTTGIQGVICSILSHVPGGGSCGEGDDVAMTDEDFVPECTIGRNTVSRDSSIIIGPGNGGSGVTLITEQIVGPDGDERYAVTVTDDYHAGAEAGKKVGEGDYEAGGTIGVDLRYGNGDTWYFDNEADYLEFKEKAEEYFGSNWNYVPGSQLFRDLPDDVPRPRVSHHQVDLELSAEGSAKVKPPTIGGDEEGEGGVQLPGDWMPSGSAGIEVGGSVRITTDRGEDMDDPSDDRTQYTVGFEVSGEAEVSGGGENAGVNGGYRGNYTVETDADGNVTKLIFETTHNFDAGVGDDANQKNQTVTRTELDITSDEDRRIVEEWMQDPMQQFPNSETAMNPSEHPHDPQRNFENLLYEQGIVSRSEYEGEFGSDGSNWIIYEESSEWLDESLDQAEHLEPPDGSGGSREFVPTDC